MFEKKRGMPFKILLVVLLLLPIFIFSDYYKTMEQEEKKGIQPVVQEEDNEDLKQEKKDVTVSISFVGDVMLDSYFADYIRNYGVDYPWESVAPLLQEADIAVVNLETCVSNQGKSLKKEKYGFRAQPETLQGLVNAGIDIVNVANNHTYDYGKTAFLDTLLNLKEYGMDYVGGGNNIKEALEVKIIIKDELKIGFLSATEVSPSYSKAGETKAGVAFYSQSNYAHILEAVKTAKEKCDLLMVVLHWGAEYQDKPEKNQINIAHELIDNGADAVVGQHAHVLQGIEIYEDKPILYNIGNFLFLKRNEKAGKTGVFNLKFTKDRFEIGQIAPVFIDHCKANLLEQDHDMKKEIINHLSSLSIQFGTEISEEGIFSN